MLQTLGLGHTIVYHSNIHVITTPSDLCNGFTNQHMKTVIPLTLMSPSRSNFIWIVNGRFGSPCILLQGYYAEMTTCLVKCPMYFKCQCFHCFLSCIVVSYYDHHSPVCSRRRRNASTGSARTTLFRRELNVTVVLGRNAKLYKSAFESNVVAIVRLAWCSRHDKR